MRRLLGFRSRVDAAVDIAGLLHHSFCVCFSGLREHVIAHLGTELLDAPSENARIKIARTLLVVGRKLKMYDWVHIMLCTALLIITTPSSYIRMKQKGSLSYAVRSPYTPTSGLSGDILDA